MDFVATTDFVTPYVIATGMPHKPTKICKKQFRKGDIITGEIKTAGGKPSFVLHKGVMVIPFSCIKQVITKDIKVSNFDNKVIKEKNPNVEVKVPTTPKEKKKQMLDMVLLGAIVGFGGTILAEKQGWLNAEDKKNRLYGALIGAFLGGYYIYRQK